MGLNGFLGEASQEGETFSRCFSHQRVVIIKREVPPRKMCGACQGSVNNPGGLIRMVSGGWYMAFYSSPVVDHLVLGTAGSFWLVEEL